MAFAGASSNSDRTPTSWGAAVATEPARLARLCADLDRRQAEIDWLTRDGAPADEIDAAFDAWWGIVEAITRLPAKTEADIKSKTRAVRTVLVAIGRDRSPEANALLASLLADLLGETVELP